MAGRCPRLGQALLGQQFAQQACVSTIRFRPLLSPTQVCRVGRLGQMWLDLGSHQFFDHEPPARASFYGERDVVAALEPLQPISQRWPCGRPALPRGYLTGVPVYVIERDLCSVHVKATYNCHWGPPRAPVSPQLSLRCAEGVSSHAIFLGCVSTSAAVRDPSTDVRRPMLEL